MSTSTLTRRAALTGTAAGAAAIVAGTAPALAVGDQDRAEWLDLPRWYVDLKNENNAAIDIVESAEEQAGEASPRPPRHLCALNDDGTVVRDVWGYPWCLSEDDIRARHDRQISVRGLDNVAALQNDLGARDKWQAEVAAERERYNVPALSAAEQEVAGRWNDIANEIARKPATSMVGIAVKLAIWKMETDLADTIEDADWNQMTALGALHDVLRFAGLPENLGRCELTVQS